MNWVFEHMGDPDFASPMPSAAGPAVEEEDVDDEHLGMIISMGFTPNQAKKALKVRTDNRFEIVPRSDVNFAREITRSIISKYLPAGMIDA